MSLSAKSIFDRTGPVIGLCKNSLRNIQILQQVAPYQRSISHPIPFKTTNGHWIDLSLLREKINSRRITGGDLISQ